MQSCYITTQQCPFIAPVQVLHSICCGAGREICSMMVNIICLIMPMHWLWLETGRLVGRSDGTVYEWIIQIIRNTENKHKIHSGNCILPFTFTCSASYSTQSTVRTYTYYAGTGTLSESMYSMTRKALLADKCVNETVIPYLVYRLMLS